MARTVTLLQLRTDARLYADARTSTPTAAHISDTELNRLVNLQLTELHELLVNARGSSYVGGTATADLTLVAGTASYALPASFMQAAAVYYVRDDGTAEPLTALPSQAEIAVYVGGDWSVYGCKRFRVEAGSLTLYPTPDAAGTVRLVYVPAFQDLTTDIATYDGVNGWEKLVALGAAREMLAIENRANGEIVSMYNEQRARIESLAGDRQAQDPLYIRDTEAEHVLASRWWLR